MKYLVLIALAACGPSANESTRTITGKAAGLYWNPSHPDPVRVNADLRDLQVEALQDGKVLKGVARSDGTFHVDGVAKGAPYWLRMAQPNQTDQYILTGADSLDFDEYALGTNDAEYPSQSSTQLTVHVDGLRDWTFDDNLEYFDPDTGTYLPFWPSADVGATEGDAGLGWFGYLINPEGVKSARVTQLKRVDDAVQGLSYATPVASALLSPFTLTDGFQDEVRAPLDDVQPADLPLSLRLSEFAQQAASVHPRYATASSPEFRVWAQPGAKDRFIAGGGFGMPVVVADLAPMPLDRDVTATLAVRSPYPNDWIASRAAMLFDVAVPVPGDAQHAVTLGSIVDVQAAGYPKDAAPLITPPTMPQVDGKDAFQDAVSAAAGAKLSWNLPQKGKATEYAITVLRWADLELAKVSSVQASLQPVAVLVVPGDVTSFPMPAGVLKGGEQYVAVIEAVHAGSNDFHLDDKAAAPFRLPQPYGRASLVTSTFAVTN